MRSVLLDVPNHSAVLLIVELQALGSLSNLRVVLLKALTRQSVQALGVTQSAIRILKILYRELSVGPERTPQGDNDVLLSVGRGLQLRKHRRGVEEVDRV